MPSAGAADALATMLAESASRVRAAAADALTHSGAPARCICGRIIVGRGSRGPRAPRDRASRDAQGARRQSARAGTTILQSVARLAEGDLVWLEYRHAVGARPAAQRHHLPHDLHVLLRHRLLLEAEVGESVLAVPVEDELDHL